MTVYIFAGPTLSPEQARQELDAIYLPPVRQGSLYRAALEQPRAIGIIDGFFEQVPSVWHKEVLWAMSEGIRVFGCASMGALRAAELAPFGMVGVGKVFEAYRDGRLTDDDEVALRHGPAEAGYIPVSEAMVNIRATLDSAAASGVVSTATKDQLERAAKDLFYPLRSYPHLLELGLQASLPQGEIEALRAWLPGGRIDQKRRDAIAMLQAIKAWIASGAEAASMNHVFEHTDQWEAVTQSVSLSTLSGKI